MKMGILNTRGALSLLLSCALLSSCVGDNRIGTSSDILVLVKTDPPMPSHCLLENQSGAWDIFTTPGYGDIHRSASPLAVTCRNPNGWRGHIDIKAVQDGYAYIGAIVAGSLASAGMAMVAPPLGIAAIAGTGIGIAGLTQADNLYEDRGHKYDSVIVVPMEEIHHDYPEAIGYPDEKPSPPPSHAAGRPKAGAAKSHEQCVTIIPISPRTDDNKVTTQCTPVGADSTKDGAPNSQKPPAQTPATSAGTSP